MSNVVTAVTAVEDSVSVSGVFKYRLVAQSQQPSNGDDGETAVDEEGIVEVNDGTVGGRVPTKKTPCFLIESTKSFLTGSIREPISDVPPGENTENEHTSSQSTAPDSPHGTGSPNVCEPRDVPREGICNED